MKKALFTEIRQTQVNILEPTDWDRYEKNKPSDKWQLIEYPSGERCWRGKYPYSTTTPEITDYSKVQLKVEGSDG